jgi:signal transduction histidine kinase
MAYGVRTGGLTEGQAAVRRLVALSVAVVVLVVAGGVTALATGSRALDELAARQDRLLVRSMIDRQLRQVTTDLTTATVWDQAYRELKPGGSLAWADQEVGSYFANNRGHAWTVVIDPQDRPFYAWVGPARADPAAQAAFLGPAASVIRRARAIEAARGGHSPGVQTNNPALAETASGLVLANGTYYLVAASTVTPEAPETLRRPGPAVLVVSGARLDQELPRLLARAGIRDGRITTAPAASPAALPLRDIDGQVIGGLAWRPKHPGLQVLMDAAPAMLLGGLATLAVAAALAWQIVRVTRRLDLHERGHEEARVALEVARDRAEAANLAKSRFLTNMSHEIRTPLNGVLGMAQVLARSELSPADREKVEVIRTSGNALLGLLNDLLDLSKIEAGRVEIVQGEFDMAAAIEAATHGFAVLAAQKEVRFITAIAPEALGVWRGDGGRFKQVVANLASNAVKFTATGEIRVCVRRTETGVACTVSDTGAGIARDRLPELFQRFAQVDPTATRKFGGTGLGLAIVRELVELMGGTVSATSAEGCGSAFTFELPLAWVGPTRAAPEPAAAEPAELPPVRILAAEDNDTNRLLLGAMLAPVGVELRMACNGREAVEAFANGAYDLVLMDIQMPVMNGVDAARAIRALEAERGLAPTPILALSANVMSHQVEEYLAAGMNGFVAKPIEMATLLGAIEEALSGGETARTAAA